MALFAGAATLGVSGLAVAQPVEVASGDDLTAWQVLEHQRLVDGAAVQAYRAYIEAYPSSPLAEVAWGRLVDLGSADLWDVDPRTRVALDRIRVSWAGHRADLGERVRPSADGVVAAR